MNPTNYMNTQQLSIQQQQQQQHQQQQPPRNTVPYINVIQSVVYAALCVSEIVICFRDNFL